MRTMSWVIGLILVSVGVLSACGGASGLPRAAEGTLLRKIQERGKIIVGVKYDQPTFGYFNPATQKNEGFDVALAREVAAYIFGDASKVEFKEAVSKDRIPFLKDGTVDIVFATMTINADRLKDIDFSVVYYVAGQRVLVPKGSAITGIADLDGKKVGTTKGSTSAANLKSLTKAEVVEFNSFGEAIQAMQAKLIDAISTDDSTLYGFALLTPSLQIVGAQFSYEPYGVGVGKGQPDVLNAVNTVIKNLKSSGKWKTIWKAEIGDRLGIITQPDPPGDDWKR